MQASTLLAVTLAHGALATPDAWARSPVPPAFNAAPISPLSAPPRPTATPPTADLDLDLWRNSTWLCTDISGDWQAFMQAQGLHWMAVSAMAVIGFGVGSVLEVHVVSPAEVHMAAVFSNLPYVPGVDSTQWGNYFLDGQPYLEHIPLADDQSWRAEWLDDGSMWVVMSGRDGAWQYAANQGISDDGMVMWSHARFQPGDINVTRTFRRLGNLTGAEAEAIQEEVVAGLSGVAWMGGAALILVVVLVVGSRGLGTKGAVPAMT